MALLSTGILAQKEIWGSAGGGQLSTHPYGYIYKTDSAGNNLVIVHEFDSLHGKNPGELTLGSNGKLYGCTGEGGSGQYLMPNGSPGQYTHGGVLFEYDPVLDSLRIVHQFDMANAAFPYDWPTQYRLLEVSPGVFYGTCVYFGRTVYKYTVATNTVSLVVTIPNFLGGSMNSTQQNYIYGPLTKAANGMIYAATISNSSCPTGFPDAGTLVRINPANNALTTVYPNPCSTINGINYSSPGLEHNGKLYSVARGGAFGQGTSFLYPGYGVVYEFNPTNNTYSKKADFIGGAGGKDPGIPLKGSNGKFYGAAGGGTPYFGAGVNHPDGSGIIYEFNPANNSITPKHEFRATLSINDEGEYGTLNLVASNGKLYGTTTTGIYSYNPVLDSVELHARLYLFENPRNLVEICRKPGYTYNATTQYTVCAGSHFRYDLHNDNATTVTWLHNGVVDATQTSPVLEFAAITAANAGTWSCTLTNACGTTTAPTLTLTVNAAGPGTITSTVNPAGPLQICPEGSVTLSGNNGGTWNTGANTPTLTVTTPGAYYVKNSNACGNTYSNTVFVDTIPSPPAPVATGGNTYLCEGGSTVLSGNTGGGVWNTGATTETITIPAVENVPYYIVNTHQCGSDTSNIILLYPGSVLDTSEVPHINTTGSLTFCEGGSVLLSSNMPPNSLSNWTWRKLDQGLNYFLGNANTSLQVTQAGTYMLQIDVPMCGLTKSDTVVVTVDTLAPTPVITALGPTTFCEGDSVKLQSDYPAVQWTLGETTPVVTVTQSGMYSASVVNTCGTVTSNSISVTALPAPTVTYNAPVSQFCSNGSNVLLTGGTPAGGSYSGTGVSGAYFSPSLAGTGNHTLTYTYFDGTCAATATQTIHVEAPQTAVLLSNQANNAFCEGGNILLFQTQFPSVSWSTGDVGVVLFVNQPGTYSYTATGACGTVTSNSLVVTTKPVSPPTYNPQTVCQGESYTINGHSYSATGTYTDHFVNLHGCDSSVITQLTVTVATSSVNPQTICAGETYTFNGHSYSTTGNYTDTLQTLAGCDSLIITQLTVTPPPNSNNPQSICAGGSYQINGHTYTVTGTYTDVFQSANGCDSTVTTQLTVIPAPGSNNSQTVCAGESYSFNGHTYSTTGTYTDTLSVAGGCDSLVHTQLTILPVAGSNNVQSICMGEGYTINGHTYTTADTYTDVFQTAGGCDSTVSTILSVVQVPVSVTQTGLLLSAPSGADAYQWILCGTGTPIGGATQAGYTATANGSYAVIVTVDGCSDTSACKPINTVHIPEWEGTQAITLYPNPAGESVWVKSDSPIRSVYVYNTVGQCVYSTQNTNRLDVLLLAPGTYWVHVETLGGSIWRGKFVKM